VCVCVWPKVIEQEKRERERQKERVFDTGSERPTKKVVSIVCCLPRVNLIHSSFSAVLVVVVVVWFDGGGVCSVCLNKLKST
jgi:hypothetical protein